MSTEIDLDALEKLAQRCTEGDPWYSDADLSGRQTYSQLLPQDRAFIAAATPHMVLDLIRLARNAAPKQAGQAAEVTEVVRTAPAHIYLQVSDDSEDSALPFPYNGETTWCQDSVLMCEVKYVRADLAAPQPKQVPSADSAGVGEYRRVKTSVVGWLLGENENDAGDWFERPEGVAPFWWRKILRAAIARTEGEGS